MNTENSAKKFYLIMSIVCALMAILVFITANKNILGGIAQQRMLVMVLVMTSIAFFSRLVPPGEK